MDITDHSLHSMNAYVVLGPHGFISACPVLSEKSCTAGSSGRIATSHHAK